MKIKILLSLFTFFTYTLLAGEQLEEGTLAPSFEAKTTGDDISISTNLQDWVVLYFYPKAGTPGCTKQACSLRDGFALLQESGVRVYGISMDDMEDQVKFKDKYQLPFDLIADPKGTIAKKYHVKGFMGLFTKRHTFIIKPGGILAKIITDIDVDNHDQQLVETLKELGVTFSE